MSKFRKRPVVIEAVQVPYNEYADDPGSGWREVPVWLQEAMDSELIIARFQSEDYWYYQISTLEGLMLASPDDWIIRGVQGELYPCKPDIFEATYEQIKEALTCECCFNEREKLPFESRNGIVYCQECWDVGCDLVECSLPRK